MERDELKIMIWYIDFSKMERNGLRIVLGVLHEGEICYITVSGMGIG